jgi:transposase-like protein
MWSEPLAMWESISPVFSGEDAAQAHLEALRWSRGRFCPHCETSYRTSLVGCRTRRVRLYYCNECRRQFTATVGTIFENSHVPIRRWFLAIYLLGLSNEWSNAHRIHKIIDVTYRTAWLMVKRIHAATELEPATAEDRPAATRHGPMRVRLDRSRLPEHTCYWSLPSEGAPPERASTEEVSPEDATAAHRPQDASAATMRHIE